METFRLVRRNPSSTSSFVRLLACSVLCRQQTSSKEIMRVLRETDLCSKIIPLYEAPASVCALPLLSDSQSRLQMIRNSPPSTSEVHAQTRSVVETSKVSKQKRKRGIKFRLKVITETLVEQKGESDPLERLQASRNVVVRTDRRAKRPLYCVLRTRSHEELEEKDGRNPKREKEKQP